jgi:RHS repeat-associated protein
MLLGVYQPKTLGTVHGYFKPGTTKYWLGSRLLLDDGQVVWQDRLGSVVKRGSTTYKYFAWGEERTTGQTLTGKEQFGTYLRSDQTGLDYAVNRWYSNTQGRFMGADPYQASGGAADPGSWNRYGYVQGDPVNWIDPHGLMLRRPWEWENCGPNWMWDTSLSGPCSTVEPGAGLFIGGMVSETKSAPPLHCRFVGATIHAPGWGKTDRTGYGYYMPVYFNFTATGGDGSYEWSNTQTVTVTATVTYSSGRTIDLSDWRAPTESLSNTASPLTGSRASYFDAPGLAQVAPNSRLGRVVSAHITWSFTLRVSVKSGGQKVDCPAVSWSATETWTTDDGKTNVTGSVTVQTRPTP